MERARQYTGGQSCGFWLQILWGRGTLVWVHFGHGRGIHHMDLNSASTKNYFKSRRIQPCNSQRQEAVVEHELDGFRLATWGDFTEISPEI